MLNEAGLEGRHGPRAAHLAARGFEGFCAGGCGSTTAPASGCGRSIGITFWSHNFVVPRPHVARSLRLLTMIDGFTGESQRLG